MKLSILYNWPLGKDSARVSLGMPNFEDNKYQFRIGTVDKQGFGGWLKPGWVNYDEISKLDVMVKKDWKIKIEKKDKSTNTIVSRHEIDCSKKWPNDAQGASCVDTGYWV